MKRKAVEKQESLGRKVMPVGVCVWLVVAGAGLASAVAPASENPIAALELLANNSNAGPQFDGRIQPDGNLTVLSDGRKLPAPKLIKTSLVNGTSPSESSGDKIARAFARGGLGAFVATPVGALLAFVGASSNAMAFAAMAVFALSLAAGIAWGWTGIGLFALAGAAVNIIYGRD